MKPRSSPSDNDKLVLVVAFNYGARQEIARAAQRMAAAVAAGDLRGQRGDRRQARELPRRAGSARSRSHHPHQRRAAALNFLLWQAAYSELVFVPTYWPDFDRAALESAITEYRRRERRFGGLIARTGS